MTTSLRVAIDRRTLREASLDMLRDAIYDGRFGMGHHLVEAELSSELGVSRGTLREALRCLQQEGLVVSGPRGLVVRSFSADDVEHLFTVRGALEATAARTLASLPDRTWAVSRLRVALREMEAADLDIELQSAADLAFHMKLVELTDNDILLRTWLFISGQVRMTKAAMREGDPGITRDNMSADRHRPIVDAIDSGDTDAARRAIEEHMAVGAQYVLAGLKQQAHPLAARR